MAKIIDGKAIAADIRKEVSEGVRAYGNLYGKTPRLVVILVGDDPASIVYVRNKQKACEKAGIRSETIVLSADTNENAIIELIKKLNNDGDVSGILVQLPLPAHIDTYAVTSAVSPLKDVDGLTPVNAGLLVHNAAKLLPCTPSGCLELLKRSVGSLDGKKAAIIGRSKLVGLPLFNLLINENVTVTMCHSHTPDLTEYTRQADIVITAAGRAHMLKGEMIKPGAVVIDVGINRLPDGSITGDADFESVSEVASLVTPVPGGVGPMTIAMLLKNTLIAAGEIHA